MTDLDDPQINALIFYPRRAQPGSSRLDGARDGTIPTGGGAELGYRLYRHAPHAPVVVLFHGNGEIAPDYDGIAPLYAERSLSLLVVDYRGYGWSSGVPRLSALLPDALAVYEALPGLFAGAGVQPDAPLCVMGRSLGSAPAIHLAREVGGAFAGLIVESGFARTLPLLARLGLPSERFAAVPDPFDNLSKVGELHLPLLIIHGERDALIPVAEAEALFEASPSQNKRLLRIAGAGHNDLLGMNPDQYFDAIDSFITAAL